MFNINKTYINVYSNGQVIAIFSVTFIYANITEFLYSSVDVSFFHSGSRDMSMCSLHNNPTSGSKHLLILCKTCSKDAGACPTR